MWYALLTRANKLSQLCLSFSPASDAALETNSESKMRTKVRFGFLQHDTLYSYDAPKSSHTCLVCPLSTQRLWKIYF